MLLHNLLIGHKGYSRTSKRDELVSKPAIFAGFA